VLSLRGSFVALVTPFREGKVDEAALRSLIRWQLDKGTDGLVPCGTTGEGATLLSEEAVRVVRACVEEARGRVPVVAGCGTNSTAATIDNVQRAKEAGADAALVVTPYYNKPTQAGILTHFRLVADATDLPVILYDIPGRTGVPIRYETILRAAQHPNILAIKDAKGDFSEVSRVLNQTDLLYFSGDDANVLPHLAIGASGLIGVTANIAPAPYRTIVDAVNRGDLHAATEQHRLLEPLVRAVMTHVPGTVATKYVLHGLGRIGSPRVRLPLVGPEEAEAATIEDELSRVRGVEGFDRSRFRPDRNAAAGGALPRVAGTTR
jgi:4-hydroxy-tetrahydrodipicolinate synthase